MDWRGLARLAALLAVIATGASGCSDDAPAADDGRHVVRIVDGKGYDPPRLEVEVGDRVKFVNTSRKNPHTAEDHSRGFVDASPEPGPTDHSGRDFNFATKRGFATHYLFPREPQTIVFRTPQTYRYLCAFSDMKGTIVVVPERD